MLRDNKMVFKNKHAESLIDSIGKELRGDVLITDESNYDATH